MQFSIKPVTTDEQLLDHISHTPFLVVTRLAGARFNRFEQAVDDALGGLLSKVCDGWGCEAGSYRLLYLPSMLPDSRALGKLQYVMIVGLGHPSEFHSKRLCAFTAMTLHQAGVARVEKMSFLESPHRSTEDSISLQGTAAIMRCRADLMQSASKLRFLQEIEYLTSPQARRHLERGLTVEPPRCKVCTLPTL